MSLRNTTNGTKSSRQILERSGRKKKYKNLKKKLVLSATIAPKSIMDVTLTNVST